MEQTLSSSDACTPLIDGAPPAPEGRVLLFPIHRDELGRPRRAAAPAECADDFDFGPRWWRAPEAEAE